VQDLVGVEGGGGVREKSKRSFLPAGFGLLGFLTWALPINVPCFRDMACGRIDSKQGQG
jgi:hypothetical protein